MKMHLVDGTYELFRAYFGAPPGLAPDGRPIGAVAGLIRTLLSLLRQDDVTHVGIAFDHVIESFRNALWRRETRAEAVAATQEAEKNRVLAEGQARISVESERGRGEVIEPTAILDEEWFVDNVIKNPQAAGAVRSLLGKDFTLPMHMSNHRVQCPLATSGGWHRDGGAIDSPRLDSLQVFYYPQDTPADLGPTEVLPSSHFLRIKRRYMTQYGSIRQAVQTVASARNSSPSRRRTP